MANLKLNLVFKLRVLVLALLCLATRSFFPRNHVVPTKVCLHAVHESISELDLNGVLDSRLVAMVGREAMLLRQRLNLTGGTSDDHVAHAQTMQPNSHHTDQDANILFSKALKWVDPESPEQLASFLNEISAIGAISADGVAPITTPLRQVQSSGSIDKYNSAVRVGSTDAWKRSMHAQRMRETVATDALDVERIVLEDLLRQLEQHLSALKFSTTSTASGKFSRIGEQSELVYALFCSRRQFLFSNRVDADRRLAFIARLLRHIVAQAGLIVSAGGGRSTGAVQEARQLLLRQMRDIIESVTVAGTARDSLLISAGVAALYSVLATCEAGDAVADSMAVVQDVVDALYNAASTRATMVGPQALAVHLRAVAWTAGLLVQRAQHSTLPSKAPWSITVNGNDNDDGDGDFAEEEDSLVDERRAVERELLLRTLLRLVERLQTLQQTVDPSLSDSGSAVAGIAGAVGGPVDERGEGQESSARWQFDEHACREAPNCATIEVSQALARLLRAGDDTAAVAVLHALHGPLRANEAL